MGKYNFLVDAIDLDGNAVTPRFAPDYNRRIQAAADEVFERVVQAIENTGADVPDKEAIALHNAITNIYNQNSGKIDTIWRD